MIEKNAENSFVVNMPSYKLCLSKYPDLFIMFSSIFDMCEISAYETALNFTFM